MSLGSHKYKFEICSFWFITSGTYGSVNNCNWQWACRNSSCKQAQKKQLHKCGRIHSIKFGEAYIDLGAQFCHGQEENIVYSMVKHLDILRHSDDWKGGFRFYRSNGDVVNPTTRKKVMDFAKSLLASNEAAEDCQNVSSVGECLQLRSPVFLNSSNDSNEGQILSESLDWINSYICSFDSNFDLTDLRLISEYKICGGDLRMNWNGLGYKTVLDVMMEKYPLYADNHKPLINDQDVLLGKEVINIFDWQVADNITIRTADGENYTAQHVIFTPSVGVLKATHQTLFYPPLPREKAEAIEIIGFGAILKVALRFPTRWWQTPELFSFLWSPEEKRKLQEEGMEWLISLRGFSQGENNPKVLIAWYAGKFVPEIEKLSKEVLRRGHHYVVEVFLAPHFNVTYPEDLVRSSWHSNPHFRGTYSYESTRAPVGGNFQEALGSPLLRKDGKPAVLFAGEATHPHYFSTVHGAIESGYREADRLLALYKNKVDIDVRNLL